MTSLHHDRKLAEKAAAKLKVFAQPNRLMILSSLLDRELSVGEIDSMTGIGQPALSQQLAELRRAELVETRREGTQIYYRLSDGQAAYCVSCLNMLANEEATPPAIATSRLSRKHIKEEKKGAAGFAKIL